MNWTPKRRGKIYCSPACGSGCTWAAYQEAKDLGIATKLRMRDQNWQVKVWENCGWHVKLHRPFMNLHISKWRGGRIYFHMLVGDGPDDIGGACHWTPTGGYSEDPNKAVENALRPVRRWFAAVEPLRRRLFGQVES